MHVREQSVPLPAPIPGVDHATWAGQAEGLTQLSVWRQRLAPGAATPPHSHDCDEVVLCQSGQGCLTVEGVSQTFDASSVLVLPRGRAHQIVNTGSTAMEIIGLFGASPVGTFGDDGAALPLPWRT